jgi:hypothetical protein
LQILRLPNRDSLGVPEPQWCDLGQKACAHFTTLFVMKKRDHGTLTNSNMASSSQHELVPSLLHVNPPPKKIPAPCLGDDQLLTSEAAWDQLWIIPKEKMLTQIPVQDWP